MKNVIGKKEIEQSINLISEIELNNEEMEDLFNRFKNILDNSEIVEKVLKAVNVKKINKIEDLKKILEILSKNIELEQLNILLNLLIKDEKLINYIQDLFLEKLI
ncbi:MAG: hypothetical protein EU549_05205 [Promethearchaeota archaeon]|nr:MAG: hypothetical protein EU549_05205 [Candidatus Lokiarchaeota archaeon]